MFDLSLVPFSHPGSYLAFSHLPAERAGAPGLYCGRCTGHGHRFRAELFRLTLAAGGNEVGFTETAAPDLLRLETGEGFVEICFAGPRTVLLRGQGVVLRLRMETEHFDLVNEYV